MQHFYNDVYIDKNFKLNADKVIDSEENECIIGLKEFVISLSNFQWWEFYNIHKNNN